jgi:hypothetical protein
VQLVQLVLLPWDQDYGEPELANQHQQDKQVEQVLGVLPENFRGLEDSREVALAAELLIGEALHYREVA